MSNSSLYLEMYRPVLDFTEASVDMLRQEAAARDITKMRMLGGVAGSKALILGPGDLRAFLDHIEIDPATVDANELSTYFDMHMPDSADDALDVPAYPFGDHMQLGKRSVHIFTLGTNNPTIREERAAVIQLTEEFFGVDGEDTTDAWVKWDYMAEIWLAKMSDPTTVESFRDLLVTRPDILPDSIALGAVVLNDGKNDRG